MVGLPTLRFGRRKPHPLLLNTPKFSPKARRIVHLVGRCDIFAHRASMDARAGFRAEFPNRLSFHSSGFVRERTLGPTISGRGRVSPTTQVASTLLAWPPKTPAMRSPLQLASNGRQQLLKVGLEKGREASRNQPQTRSWS